MERLASETCDLWSGRQDGGNAWGVAVRGILAALAQRLGSRWRREPTSNDRLDRVLGADGR